jgi:hypothetical protein
METTRKLARLFGGGLSYFALSLDGCGGLAAAKLLTAKTMMTGTVSVASGHMKLLGG